MCNDVEENPDTLHEIVDKVVCIVLLTHLQREMALPSRYENKDYFRKETFMVHLSNIKVGRTFKKHV